jgi:hypothetical protein
LSNCKLVSESSNVDVPTDLKAGELIEHEGKMRPISARWGSGYRVHILDGIIAVADAISDNGAISKLIFNGGVTERGHWVEGGTVTLESSMTEANFSGKLLSYEAHIVCAFLPKCT